MNKYKVLIKVAFILQYLFYYKLTSVQELSPETDYSTRVALVNCVEWNFANNISDKVIATFPMGMHSDTHKTTTNERNTMWKLLHNFRACVFAKCCHDNFFFVLCFWVAHHHSLAYPHWKSLQKLQSPNTTICTHNVFFYSILNV